MKWDERKTGAGKGQLLKGDGNIQKREKGTCRGRSNGTGRVGKETEGRQVEEEEEGQSWKGGRNTEAREMNKRRRMDRKRLEEDKRKTLKQQEDEVEQELN